MFQLYDLGQVIYLSVYDYIKDGKSICLIGFGED